MDTMDDYIRVFDDDCTIPTFAADDPSPDDEPLLTPNGLDHQQPHKCLYGQKGFKNPTTDIQSLRAKRQLLTATIICAFFMIAEIIGGYLAGSLAVITDAAHLLSDCISFIVALCAIWLAKRPADEFMSFGYKRVEVVGAVMSVLGIWALTGVLIYLAIVRIVNWDFDIDADTMIIISTVGVAFNVAMAIVLHGSCASVLHAHSHGGCDHTKKTRAEAPRLQLDVALPNQQSFKGPECNGLDEMIDMQTGDDRRGSFDSSLTRNAPSDGRGFHHCRSMDNYVALEQNGTVQRHIDRMEVSVRHEESPCDSKKSKNINVRAAMIHIIGDFIQSIGVLIAAIIIKIFPSAKIADPICTFIFSIIVMFTTFHIIRDAVTVLLDAVPKNISLTKLQTEIFCLEGVKSVHHLNVWSISMDWNVMSVHLIIDHRANSSKIIEAVSSLAKKSFNIQQSTCQIERSYESAGTKSYNSASGPDVILYNST